MTSIVPDFAALGGGMHTAGIFSDMTVDGPEIGTLVVIVDRAKNLPNRKTMGKQNPYCAARLGKEAKKTETDKRGGQTPKWDQELRFTVHESPDYNNLKVSVFNDDKKTDLIGEMWVNLEQVVIPGGGKKDDWHQLSYKGKYAGEVMLELTYYDSRPDERGDKPREKAHEKKIKRRPLPAELHTTPLPHQMENTRTAGPRAMGSRTRASSSMTSASHPNAPPVQYPNEHHYQQEQPQQQQQYPPDIPPYHPQSHQQYQPYPHQQHHQPAVEDLDYHPGYRPQHQQLQQQHQQHHSMPSLPELPPSRSSRGALPQQLRTSIPDAASYHARSQGHPELPHSHSAPTTVPQTHDPYGYPQARTPRSRAYDASLQPTVEDEIEDLPPLPPSHRMRGPPPRSQSVDEYGPPPLGSSQSTPNFRKSYSGPPPPQSVYAPSNAGSSPGYPRPSSSSQRNPRHIMADPYDTVTPPRTHPLASEMRRSASPAPYYAEQQQQQGFEDPYQRGYPPDGAPMIKPRAISPAPAPQPRSSLASIRHPVQTYAAHDSTSGASAPNPSPSPLQKMPTRKSVSPRPSTSGSGSVPFSPDDYGSFNPNASQTSRYTHSQSTNPRMPYHIPNSPHVGTEEQEPPRPLPDPDGPITTWDGRTVDPSDHLPVHSWAPEPVKKTPEKQYGAGAYDPNRPRGLSGPRHNIHNVPATGGRVGRDVVVNVRSKHGSPNPSMNSFDSPSANGTPPSRNRLLKRRSDIPQSSLPHDASNYPLNEIEIPNPYAGGQHRYSEGYADNQHVRHRSRSPAPPGYQQPPPPQQQQRHYGDIFGGDYENASQYGGRGADKASQYGGRGGDDQYHNGYGNERGRAAPQAGYYGRSHAYSEPPPELPPKIPFDDHAYGVSALEKELSRIDIGGSTLSQRGGGTGTVVARRGRWAR
ncbi:hypothetical protein AAFC00_000805 [Neodothiora populina]|uniref:C2 domain-containing protein n=1 Tax=Neodothiora populina TaxID=2781224 RepID=A0ABR3PLV7_9PEZI